MFNIWKYLTVLYKRIVDKWLFHIKIITFIAIILFFLWFIGILVIEWNNGLYIHFAYTTYIEFLTVPQPDGTEKLDYFYYNITWAFIITRRLQYWSSIMNSVIPSLYILTIVLPLFSFILSGIFGRLFGREGSIRLVLLNIGVVWLISLYMFYDIGLQQNIVIIKLYNWLKIELYDVSIGLLFDPLSSTMVLIIATISGLVQTYSVGYMSHDPHITRFLSYLSLFTTCMLILVTADNFVQMFFGWEGVGLCSYLLINFWFTRIAANKAALKAMIMNRIADVFFIIGIVMILLLFKTTNYLLVFNLVPFTLSDEIYLFGFCFYKITLIAFFLFIGAIGKSAQFGFHTWLPEAMEGPTPVSALLHAATMVTAGVFLVCRCSIFFEYSENILFLLTLFGGITAYFAGLVAIFQYDIKKIIAYSTCSQLGYMFFSCGLSNYYVAFFHLFNHAFFKALLFLSSGVVIHAFFDEQDIRRMSGNTIQLLPLSYICILIGSLAIMGTPFLTGFYSKDLILEVAYTSFMFESSFIYFIGISSASFTVIYSIRLIYLVFYQEYSNMYRSIYDQLVFSRLCLNQHNFYLFECTLFMLIPLFILIFCSIFVGYLFSDLMSGDGTFFWGTSIFILPKHLYLIEVHFISGYIKNIPLFICIIFTYLTYQFFNNLDKFYSSISITIQNRYNFYLYPFITEIKAFFYSAGYINNVYNWFFLNFYKLSYTDITKNLDKGNFEYFGPWGVYSIFFEVFNSFKLSFPAMFYYNIFFFMLISTVIIVTALILYLSFYSVLFYIFYHFSIIIILFLLIK